MTRNPIRLSLVAVLVAAAFLVAPSATAQSASDDGPRLNQLQVMGSHNSYHEIATDAERALRRQFLGDAEDEFEYYHRPLDVQFESEKVRQIELDVFDDAKGGTYADPLIRSITGGGPYDVAMKEPGIKVLHAQDVDYHSTCITLKDCLGTVKQWSDANPTHVPIAILIELKDDIIDTGTFEFVHPDPWNKPALDRLDNEIRSVFAAADLITPDDVRGDSATLKAAVTSTGWPTLEDSRGKVMFLMDNGGQKRTDYLAGHPSLAGRVLFTNAEPSDDDAAFVKRNDARDPSIPGLVRDGFVVRTRTDVPANEALKGDYSTLEAALASGAQWLSTDYPVAGYSDGYGTGYVAELPGGTVARCNPVNAPDTCDSKLLDTNFNSAPRPAGIAEVQEPGPPPTTPGGNPLDDGDNPLSNPTPPAEALPMPARFTG